jgi:hypothetical protein
MAHGVPQSSAVVNSSANVDTASAGIIDRSGMVRIAEDESLRLHPATSPPWGCDSCHSPSHTTGCEEVHPVLYVWEPQNDEQLDRDAAYIHFLNIREGRQQQRREMVRVRKGTGAKGEERQLTGEENEGERHEQWVMWKEHSRRHSQDVAHFMGRPWWFRIHYSPVQMFHGNQVFVGW